MKTHTVKLTEAEKNQLITILDCLKRDGWYFGNQEQWNKRTEAITAKLTPPPVSLTH